jgi:hypothetical protein
MVRPPKLSPTSRGPRAMDLLDESLSLLRGTPLWLFFIYYAGAAPFCLGLVYFVFDLLESPRAELHLAPLSLGLTVLYLWMKTCQAVFARRLLERLQGGEAEPWTLARWGNTALLQAVFGGSLLVVYPAALLMTIPFGWVNAFYHSISIVATGPRSTVRGSINAAAKLSTVWPRQNHLILGIQLVALLFLFVNVGAMLAIIPALLDMLFGISTIFDQNESALSNSSYYLDVSVLCFLVMNPVSKAVYVLRCFYGRARFNGSDLRAELRFHQRESRRERPPVRLLALLAAMLVPFFALPARADAPPAPSAAAVTTEPLRTNPNPPRILLSLPPEPAPSTKSLNTAIDQTLQKDEFAWRQAEAAAPQEDNSFLGRLARSVGHFRDYVLHKIGRAFDKVADWIFGHQHSPDVSASKLSTLQAIPWRLIFVLLAVVVVLVLAMLVLRYFRRKPGTGPGIATAAPVRSVDLEAEDVRADQLPEDSWLALAQDLIAKGELRLALRALYLATLSILAHSELIRLGAAKSNRDYLTELARRLRGREEAVPVFRDSVHLFEASWYGTHAVTDDVLGRMRSNHQTVRGHVAA